MAYSKTSPTQVAAQLAAGAAVLGIVYHSLYKKPEQKPSLQSEAGQSPSSVVTALEKEASQTSGKYWALQQQQRATGGPSGDKAQGGH